MKARRWLVLLTRLAQLLVAISLGVASAAALIEVQTTSWAWLTLILGGVVIGCITASLLLVLTLTDRVRHRPGVRASRPAVPPH